MKDAKFAEYTERCLGLARGRGFAEEIVAKEKLAWELHAEFPPAGSLLLGDLLLRQGISHLKPGLDTRDFARSLVATAGPALQAIEPKDGWDHYYLGVGHTYGRGVPNDLSKAAGAFTASADADNLYADFEAVWARHLSGGPRLAAILGLLGLGGRLADFATASAGALALLELGPVREPASPGHIARLLLLRKSLRATLYHDHGSRQTRVAIHKELRAGVAELQRISTPRACLALYLTASILSVNPTGKPPAEWFQAALGPGLEELETMCRCHEFDREELGTIVRQAEREGWRDAPLARLAATRLEPYGD